MKPLSIAPRVIRFVEPVVESGVLLVRSSLGDAAAKKYMNRIARLHPDKLVRVWEGGGRRKGLARALVGTGRGGGRMLGRVVLGNAVFHKTYVAL